MSALGFRKDVQGLRAIAVLSVVIFHAGADWLRGGFVGVDIFFVISGYLITKILAKENSSGSYSLFEFYKRRLRRLMPALVVMLCCSLLAGFLLLSAADMRDLGLTAASTVLFGSNIAFLKQSDYFATAAEFKPLLHTWSLAVEEQFYIVFPPLLALLWKFGRSTVSRLIVVAIALSLIASVALGLKWPSAGFYLPVSRAYELLIGSFIALNPTLLDRLGARGRDAASIAGLVTLGISLLAIDEKSIIFPGYVALLPCIGTALILASGEAGTTIAGRAISSPSFLFFGNLSYSLYLWHWPILVFAKHYKTGALESWEAAVCVIAAIAIAQASYRFVETPFTKGFPRFPVIRTGLVAIGVIAAIGGGFFVTRGWPARFSPEARQLAATSQTFSPDRARCHGKGDKLRSYKKACAFGGGRVEVAVWGDSSGAELAPTLGKVLAQRGVGVREVTSNACPPALGLNFGARPLCIKQNDRNLAALSADPTIKTVVLSANFEIYGKAREQDVASGMDRTVAALRQAGKQVVLVGPIPNQEYDPPSALSLHVGDGSALAAWGRGREKVDAANRSPMALLEAIAEKRGALLVNSIALFCDARHCAAYDPGAGAMYFNQTHLSMAGAERLANAVARSI